VTNRSTAETVAITGAGIGGCYPVAELGIAGFKPRLHDIDESRAPSPGRRRLPSRCRYRRNGTPAIDALVEVVRKMSGKVFAEEARTLEHLRPSGMDAPQIRSLVDEGFPISV
jgi:hypothetical protein